MSISQRTVSLDVAGRAVPLYVAVPESGSGPGLLLLHDAHGAGDHMKHQANLYAEEGWVVALPDLYAPGQSGSNFAYDPAGVAGAGAAAPLLEGESARAVARASLAALRTLPELTGPLGVVGHGAGVHLAIALAAGDPALACAVAYGVPAAAAAWPACPTIVHVGEADPACAGGHLARLREALAASPQVSLHVYPGAGADFDNRNAANYDRAHAGMAKSRTLACLRAALGPRYDLATLWDAHLFSEFVERDVDVSMDTMVDEPYVLVVPTVTGGTGKRDLHRWYSNHFHFQNPTDTRIVPVSRTVGADRIVDEFVFCFTHDRVMDWLLPGVAPTGKYIEVPMMAVVNFRGTRLYHEHIWWDQACVLVQAGLLDPTGLPVTGAEQAAALLDETLPRNRLIPAWQG